MPPPDAHRQLKPAEKETLRRWIAEGAEWQTHWSYIRPERPEHRVLARRRRDEPQQLAVFRRVRDEIESRVADWIRTQ